MPADVLPWRPYGAGQTYGLTLALDVDINEYYCSSTAGAGFKVRFMLQKSLFFILFLFILSSRGLIKDAFESIRLLE